jgi:hypothetical protein
MLRVTTDSTSAARAKSLNVRRSPRCEKCRPKPTRDQGRLLDAMDLPRQRPAEWDEP